MGEEGGGEIVTLVTAILLFCALLMQVIWYTRVQKVFVDVLLFSSTCTSLSSNAARPHTHSVYTHAPAGIAYDNTWIDTIRFLLSRVIVTPTSS